MNPSIGTISKGKYLLLLKLECLFPSEQKNAFQYILSKWSNVIHYKTLFRIDFMMRFQIKAIHQREMYITANQ